MMPRTVPHIPMVPSATISTTMMMMLMEVNHHWIYHRYRSIAGDIYVIIPYGLMMVVMGIHVCVWHWTIKVVQVRHNNNCDKKRRRNI